MCPYGSRVLSDWTECSILCPMTSEAVLPWCPTVCIHSSLFESELPLFRRPITIRQPFCVDVPLNTNKTNCCSYVLRYSRSVSLKLGRCVLSTIYVAYVIPGRDRTVNCLTILRQSIVPDLACPIHSVMLIILWSCRCGRFEVLP